MDEVSEPELNHTIPQVQRDRREQLRRDCEAFLQAGGRIRTEADEMDPEQEITHTTFASMLGVTGVAMQTGLRNGTLFGATFPTPIRNPRNSEPIFRAGDVQRFMRERRA